MLVPITPCEEKGTLKVDRPWDIAEPLTALNRRYAAMAPEQVIEPDLPIVDPHHHLWDRPPQRYLLDELLVDLSSGHNVVATVFVECTAMWRSGGPTHLRSAGEVEFAAGVAAMSESGLYGPCAVHAGIVSYLDLRDRQHLDSMIGTHLSVSGGRLRGVRNRATYEPLIGEFGPLAPSQGMLINADFQASVRDLGEAGLLFESWQYHTQIPDFTQLARAAPDTTLVLDHLGGILGVGPYGSTRNETFSQWRSDMTELADCSNVYVKVGGMGMSLFGFGLNNREVPPSSQELAEAWRPYVETCIELFGAGRCMFESNFPPDLQTASYHTLWNAFKRLASGCSDCEKRALFAGTANAVYRLGLTLPDPQQG